MPYYVIAPPAQERTRLFAPLAGVQGGRTATPFKGSPVTANRTQSSPFASPRISRLNLSVLNPPFRQHRTSASQSARLPSPAASSLDANGVATSMVAASRMDGVAMLRRRARDKAAPNAQQSSAASGAQYCLVSESPFARGVRQCKEVPPLLSSAGKKMGGMGAGARLSASDPKSRELDTAFTQGVTFLEQRLHAYSKVRERELKLKPQTATSAALTSRVARPASPSFQEWMQEVFQEQPQVRCETARHQMAVANLVQGSALPSLFPTAASSSASSSSSPPPAASPSETPRLAPTSARGGAGAGQSQNQNLQLSLAERLAPVARPHTARGAAGSWQDGADSRGGVQGWATEEEEGEDAAAQATKFLYREVLEREARMRQEALDKRHAAAAAAHERKRQAAEAREELRAQIMSAGGDSCQKRQRTARARPGQAALAASSALGADGQRPTSAPAQRTAPWAQAPLNFPKRDETTTDFLSLNASLLAQLEAKVSRAQQLQHLSHPFTPPAATLSTNPPQTAANEGTGAQGGAGSGDATARGRAAEEEGDVSTGDKRAADSGTLSLSASQTLQVQVHLDGTSPRRRHQPLQSLDALENSGTQACDNGLQHTAHTAAGDGGRGCGGRGRDIGRGELEGTGRVAVTRVGGLGSWVAGQGGGFRMDGYFPEEMKQAALCHYLKAREEGCDRAQRTEELRVEKRQQQAQERRERIGLMGNKLRLEQEQLRQQQLLGMAFLAMSANKIWAAIDSKRQAFLSEAQLIRLDASKGIQIGLALLIAASFRGTKRELGTGKKVLPADSSARAWPYLARAHTCLKQVVEQCSSYTLSKTAGRHLDVSLPVQLLRLQRTASFNVLRTDPGGDKTTRPRGPKEGTPGGKMLGVGLHSFGLHSEQHLQQVLRVAVVLDRLVVNKQRKLQQSAADLLRPFLFAATRGRPMLQRIHQFFEQVMKIQKWWRQCFQLHVARRALMKTVVERLRALKLASADIRCMPFLPLKSVIHLLEPELRPGQGQAGEACKGLRALHRAGSPGKSKCHTVERQEWAALHADLIALLQARAHHHMQQQRQTEQGPEQGHARDEHVQAEAAVSSPAPPRPHGRGGKGPVRHRRHHHHARHGAGDKGAHGKAAGAATAAETKEASGMAASSVASAQKQRQTHEQLLLLAAMPAAKVSEYAKAGEGLLAVRQVVESSKFGLQVGAPMRYRVLRNQLAAVQDKYLFMRKRFCDATDVFLGNQRLLQECRLHVQLYRSGAWLEQGPPTVSAQLASAGCSEERTLDDSPRGAGHESQEAQPRAPVTPSRAEPPGSSFKRPSSKRAVRPRTGVTRGTVRSPVYQLAQPVPQRVAEGLQGSLGTGIAFADDLPMAYAGKGDAAHIGIRASPWALGLGRRNLSDQLHLRRADDVSSDSDSSLCRSEDADLDDVIKAPAALMLAKPPARARFPLALTDAQHVFGWLQEASGEEMELHEAARGLPGPYFQQIVSANESAQQELSRRRMDALAEELLPVEHGALGALDSGGGGGARVSVDMPLHLIPPFVPVDLPSRKKLEQAVDHLEDVLLSALCCGDREKGSSGP